MLLCDVWLHANSRLPWERTETLMYRLSAFIFPTSFISPFKHSKSSVFQTCSSKSLAERISFRLSEKLFIEDTETPCFWLCGVYPFRKSPHSIHCHACSGSVRRQKRIGRGQQCRTGQTCAVRWHDIRCADGEPGVRRAHDAAPADNASCGWRVQAVITGKLVLPRILRGVARSHLRQNTDGCQRKRLWWQSKGFH